jgi:hypothetical protein
VNTSSGYGVWTNYTTIAGHFLLYCDESNGYYVYTEAGSWAKITFGGGATQVANVDPANLVFPLVFKERVWFVERNSGNAWYLPTGSIYGAAVRFSFGNKFKYGGNLMALFNWSIDAGIGLEDQLVAMSGGGDVIVYQGTDPSTAASFLQKGQWYIGPPPAGRRIAGTFGGDLFLLSSYGLIPITRLLSSTLITESQIMASGKISPIINSVMSSKRTSLGWEVKYLPSENILLISTPTESNIAPIQFVQSLNDLGWGMYRDVPYLTGNMFNGTYYIGTNDGRVVTHTGNTDNVSNGAGGWLTTDITFSYLQTFQDPGPSNVFKRINFIRPVFLSQNNPINKVEARYDFDLNEITSLYGAAVQPVTSWDTSIWDSAYWSGPYVVSDKINGGAGMGRRLSVAMIGKTSVPTVHIENEITYDSGGIL